MIEKFSLCSLLTIAFFTWALFILNVYFHIPLTTLSTLLTLVMTATIVYFTIGTKFKTTFRKPKKLFGTEKVLLLLLLGIIGVNILLNWFWLPVEFDAITMYDFRAKIFSQTHNIQEIANGYHGSFPLFTSMAHAVIYLWGFENPKIFYSLLVVLFLMLFFAKLEQKIGRRGALVGCLLLITIPTIFSLARHAYLNFPYLVFMGTSLIYLVNYLEDQKKTNLIIFSIFIALASWVRAAHHPFFIANLFIVLLFAYKRRSLKEIFIPIIFYICIFGPWYFYQYYIMKITTYELNNMLRFTNQGFPIPILVSIWEILKTLIANFTNIKYGGGVGIVFLILTALQLIMKKRFGKSFFSYFVIFINTLAWIGLSLLIQTEFPEIKLWSAVVADSMGRLYILFFPVIIYTMLQLPIFDRVWISNRQ